PDVRGCHDFYKDLALRFAEVGVSALAMDYFGRTAGISPRDASFEFMPHVQQLRLATLLDDVRAALAHLRQNEGAHSSIFTLGFCMGGTLSLVAGTQDFDLAGVIAFYSGLSRPVAGTDRTALERAHESRYPVLGLYGGADQGIPVSAVEQLDKELDRAGVEHQIKVYDGAPHSFFDRKYEEFAAESADAWTRVLDFIHAHSKQPA
ncbi:MAG: dienelactone hydrolase family protein, partial [Chloroflexi bacterium]|nr:dienelactone hydrolase family protein [Chloroflexota bacterium]